MATRSPVRSTRTTNGCCSPTEGTIYPVLREFEEGGYVTSETSVVSGRQRKTYTLTGKGREAFAVGVDAWMDVTRALVDTERLVAAARQARLLRLIFLRVNIDGLCIEPHEVRDGRNTMIRREQRHPAVEPSGDLPVAIIGGGPIGLAAAAHLLRYGLEPVVLEAGETVGWAVRDWAHVQMFSSWSLNLDRAAVALLEQQGWQVATGRRISHGRGARRALSRAAGSTSRDRPMPAPGRARHRRRPGRPRQGEDARPA